jgi:hypothetical protein
VFLRATSQTYHTSSTCSTNVFAEVRGPFASRDREEEVAINLTSDRPWLQEAKLDLTRILVPLEAGKLFRFPNLWGDEGSHYVRLNPSRK